MSRSSDDPDLEPLDPDGIEHSSAARIGSTNRRGRHFLLVAMIALAALAASLVVTLVEIRELHRRVDHLQAIQRTSQTTTKVDDLASKYCLSFPLVGQVTFVPAQTVGTSFSSAGHFGGDVGGLPPNTYVLIQFFDTSTKPAHKVQEITLRSNANGAQHIDGPSLVGPANISAVLFRVGTNNQDLRLFGPPATPC
ncbi:MAG: hypothetical protein M3Q30_17655 [Actinomycetota bacterium]|nr:hypothetical protein [Actinomycetota bacterium]